MAWEKLTEARLEEVLTAYKADIPLGMIREENDFRISVAGAQEKTALLRIGNDWCIPKGITPTTHIIKYRLAKSGSPMRRSISAKALIMSITVCCWRKNLG